MSYHYCVELVSKYGCTANRGIRQRLIADSISSFMRQKKSRKKRLWPKPYFALLFLIILFILNINNTNVVTNTTVTLAPINQSVIVMIRATKRTKTIAISVTCLFLFDNLFTTNNNAKAARKGTRNAAALKPVIVNPSLRLPIYI